MLGTAPITVKLLLMHGMAMRRVPPSFCAQSRNLIGWPLREILRLRFASRRMTEGSGFASRGMT